MFRCSDSKSLEAFMHRLIREQIAPAVNASGHEVNWISFKNKIEAGKSWGFQI